eukprot:m.643945 g.643945  ORF g.643945 m.643945 type:complete len:167 (+) comp22646_c0_seq5:1917-2417(+)
MMKMEEALREEEAELVRQQRIIEIDRLEEEKYPEIHKDKAGLAAGDDAFTKEMKAHGLLHVTGDKEEKRIKHTDLPEEFDLFSYTRDLPSTSPWDRPTGPDVSHDTVNDIAAPEREGSSLISNRENAVDEAVDGGSGVELSSGLGDQAFLDWCVVWRRLHAQLDWM